VRRHYVYYRVDEAEVAAVIEAVKGWQRALCERHPGLHAELLRRPDLREGQVTLMEAYGPLDDALAGRIETEARVLLPGLQRHVEAFDLLD
jgi:hypothetical protein